MQINGWNVCVEQIDYSIAQNLLSHLSRCDPRAMFALLEGRNSYFAEHHTRPNYETEDQNFPLEPNLQAMRLHKILRV
jgi:hypothetical protein